MSRAIDRSTRVFFDASCLIAAAGRPAGGSGFLLSLCARDLLRGAVSQPVLLEAERNVRAKLPPDAIETYHRLLQTTPLILTNAPSPEQLRRFRDRIDEKDAHVVAAAVGVSADYLLTLDKPLEERVNAAGLPVSAVAPGGFITNVLPLHAEYERLR